MANDDWMREWDSVVDAIGTDLDADKTPASSADAIETGTLRRYLEPLEFGCALHYNAEVARAHGYNDIIAPYTAALSYTMQPMWLPGEPPLFDSDDRDAQPERSAVKPTFPNFFPPFTGYFATDIDIDFLRPALLGERLSRRGSKLVSCNLKETHVGRGAFLKMEAEIVTETGEIIARMRTGLFLYSANGKTVV